MARHRLHDLWCAHGGHVKIQSLWLAACDGRPSCFNDSGMGAAGIHCWKEWKNKVHDYHAGAPDRFVWTFLTVQL